MLLLDYSTGSLGKSLRPVVWTQYAPPEHMYCILVILSIIENATPTRFLRVIHYWINRSKTHTPAVRQGARQRLPWTIG
jgi:hypothetical protein